MQIEVSNGEIMDKLSIIQLKLERIKEKEKLVNLKREFDELSKAANDIMKLNDPLYLELYHLNSGLWDIEDHIRDLERNQDFGEDFILTARSVYKQNDLRARVKREINIRTSSGLIEEKSYKEY